MKISPTAIAEAAKVFQQSSEDISGVYERLEKSMETLRKGWPELSEQELHKTYEIWMDQSIGLVHLLKSISSEFRAIERRYHEIETSGDKK